MKHLLTVATALSLLAFLALVALLVASIAGPKQVVWGSGPGSLILYSSGGELSIARGYYDPVAKAAPGTCSTSTPPPSPRCCPSPGSSVASAASPTSGSAPTAGTTCGRAETGARSAGRSRPTG